MSHSQGVDDEDDPDLPPGWDPSDNRSVPRQAPSWRIAGKWKEAVMRRVAVVCVVAIVALSAGLALGAGDSPQGEVKAERVSILTIDEPKTLDGTESEFHSIYNTDLEATSWFGKLVLARGRMVINLSANVEGGPVDFRVTNGGRVLYPSATHFDPQGNSTSFSYTFIARGSKDGSCHYIDPEWRAAGGAEVTLTDLVMTITYNRDLTSNGKPFACA